MALILHAGKTNKNSFKTLIAAEYSGIDVKLADISKWALIEQWIDFATLEIDANIISWVRPRMGRSVYLPPAEEATIAALKRALGSLNTHLANSTYLVGHSVTLADIVMTMNLFLGFTYLMTKSFTSEFPHVERYFWTMVNQPNFKKVMGEVKQTESVLPIPSKKPSQPKEAKPKAKDEPKKKSRKSLQNQSRGC
ncbi:hypothetical protein GQ457_18G020120 [Hibiscus cannabinus]